MKYYFTINQAEKKLGQRGTMKSFTTILLGLFLLTSCGSGDKKLSEKGLSVKVLKNRSTDCQVIGKYQGRNNGGSVELARNHARNQAAEDGANSIYFEEEFANGARWTVHAIAYNCGN
jgi:hypothetical protein